MVMTSNGWILLKCVQYLKSQVECPGNGGTQGVQEDLVFSGPDELVDPVQLDLGVGLVSDVDVRVPLGKGRGKPLADHCLLGVEPHLLMLVVTRRVWKSRNKNSIITIID